MNHHLSRRELVRRMTQGREAIRLLSAIVIEHGGVLRVERDSYLNQPTTTRLEVHQDPLTGTYTLKASHYGEDHAAPTTPPRREADDLCDDAVVGQHDAQDDDPPQEVGDPAKLQR